MLHPYSSDEDANFMASILSKVGNDPVYLSGSIYIYDGCIPQFVYLLQPLRHACNSIKALVLCVFCVNTDEGIIGPIHLSIYSTYIRQHWMVFTYVTGLSPPPHIAVYIQRHQRYCWQRDPSLPLSSYL
jgi:hypothetical protein